MTPMITWDWPGTPLTILAVIVLTVIARWILVKLIRSWAAGTGRFKWAGNAIGEVIGVTANRRRQRLKTSASLLTNVVNIAAFLIALMTCLSVLGIPMGPLLAGAGIGGIAIGFGAQSLIKDVISGLFLVLEDQYGVGDLIDVGGVEGTVEAVGLRVTRIRNWNGQVWYIRNGEITRLGNQSQGWSTAMISIPTHLSEDPERVIKILETVSDEFWEDPGWRSTVNERPDVLGLDSVSGQAMNFTIMIKTPANKQFTPQRALRSRSLIALQKAGVRAPSQLVETIS